MKIWKAILVGQLVVNLPVVGIMVVVLFGGLMLFPIPWQLFAILGSLLGWIWWSYAVPRWRDWAHDRGADPNRLQKSAVRTGLTWPKGSRFEKTEFRWKK